MLSAWCVFNVFGCALSGYHLSSHWVRVCLHLVYVVIEHMVNSKWFQISTPWTQKNHEHALAPICWQDTSARWPIPRPRRTDCKYFPPCSFFPKHEPGFDKMDLAPIYNNGTFPLIIMTPWLANAFRITGLLWGKSPHKGSTRRSFDASLLLAEQVAEQTV